MAKLEPRGVIPVRALQNLFAPYSGGLDVDALAKPLTDLRAPRSL